MKEQPGNVLRANRDGQVVIPSEVVARLGVNAGEGLQWIVEDGRLELTPRIKFIKKLIGLFGHSKHPAVESTENGLGTKTTKNNQSANPPELEREPSDAKGAP
jgi:bifunctional DNA-binding transcriptional regulator/antitoxin component of YhaV-PrlF toxin-antitoxin module